MSNTLPHRTYRGKIYTIYTLIDPRNQEIRYIGITYDVYQRMRQHSRCEGDNTAKNAWIQELQQEQLMFIMHSLEKVKTFEEALDRESYWIQQYLENGASLLNRAKVSITDQIEQPVGGFVRYSTDRFLGKLYFVNSHGEVVCFADASALQFVEYLGQYVEEDWQRYGRLDTDARFSPWNANGYRCKWLNHLRIHGCQLEIYNHRGEQVTDLMGNPLKPQKLSSDMRGEVTT